MAAPLPIGTKVFLNAEFCFQDEPQLCEIAGIQWINNQGEIVEVETGLFQYLLDTRMSDELISALPSYVEAAE